MRGSASVGSSSGSLLIFCGVSVETSYTLYAIVGAALPSGRDGSTAFGPLVGAAAGDQDRSTAFSVYTMCTSRGVGGGSMRGAVTRLESGPFRPRVETPTAT